MEKIKRTWADYILHLGNTTTNKVESSHQNIKKYLMNSKGYFARGWEAMHSMLVLQFSDIQTSFGRSYIVLKHRYRCNFLYYNLEYKVHRVGLNFIYDEASQSKEFDTDRNMCNCVITTSYMFPCAYIIAIKFVITGLFNGMS